MSNESFKGSRNNIKGVGRKNSAAFFPFLIVTLWLTNCIPPEINAHPVDRDSLQQVNIIRRNLGDRTEENDLLLFGKDHFASRAIFYKLKGNLKWVHSIFPKTTSNY
jgi:hypothetical protein